MAKIICRIDEIRKKEGLTIGALENLLGASKGVLSKAIANGTDIQLKWLEAFVENFPQYSVEWIVTGKGDMTPLPATFDKIQLTSYKVIISNLERKVKVQKAHIDELERANEELTRQLLEKTDSKIS